MLTYYIRISEYKQRALEYVLLQNNQADSEVTQGLHITVDERPLEFCK